MRKLAQEEAQKVFGNRIYVRGLIEFSNYCRNDCLYCGIRRSNAKADRYRLTKEEILACCRAGYGFGFRTFVLQSGEDMGFSAETICDIVKSIRTEFPDCAITLSVGERSRESYEAFYRAGAERYLLRHETASEALYEKLHPKELTLANRMRCLAGLEGYRVPGGSRIHGGAPGQTVEHLAQDFLYLAELKPHMIGIGPFIHHQDTPFRDCPDGTLEMTLYCLSILRLMFPNVLLPATTALGTIDQGARAGRGSRSECHHAQPFAEGGAGKVPSVRRKDLYRGGGSGMSRLPGESDEIYWISNSHGPGDYPGWTRE